VSSINNNNNKQNILFIVPCAGFGSRMGLSIPKQYIVHKNLPLIYYTLKKLHTFSCPIILAVSKQDTHIETIKHMLPHSVDIQYIGGQTRAQTVINALQYARKNYAISCNTKDQKNPWVLVHDAARPLVNVQDIQRLIHTCIQKNCGGILAHKIVDTLKKAQNNAQNITEVEKTIDRHDVYAAQTPKMFRLDILQQALLQCNDSVTDESSAIEQFGTPSLIVEGSKLNIKITQAEDLLWLNFL
jgi:2-C-methyl-D-erythritol 4-phosphate cytidylyltransferase